jgi:uncharacterized phage-like protein YoqJ
MLTASNTYVKHYDANYVNKCRGELRMTENKTLAFTVMRASDLPWGYNESHAGYISMRSAIRDKLVQLITDEHVRHFTSGIGMGLELLCAEIVLELKTSYTDITLSAVVPYMEQDTLWPQKYRDRYREVLRQCDYIHVMSLEYSDDCIKKHRRFLVDSCDLMLAVWHGKPGYSRDLAAFVNKPFLLIDPLGVKL